MKYKAYEYTCIAAWGRRMGSFDYYIRAQQEKAMSEEAPITAIYERDGVWSVAEEIRDPAQRKAILGDHYDEAKHGQYGAEWDVEADVFDRLPRVCAAFEFTQQKPILIYRGVAGYTGVAADFDVERFNTQRKITTLQVMAMLNGSMFGWETAGADPSRVIVEEAEIYCNQHRESEEKGK